MRLSCLQENLNKGLSIVNKIVPSQASLPVLNNILLKTEKGQLKISATNLEIGINKLIGAKIEKEGAITVPARLFSEYINSLPNEKIDLEVKDNNVNIHCKNYKATILGIDASEFPLIPEIKQKPIISITPELLHKAISCVTFAAAIDESRPVLAGVFLNFKDNQLKLVATDSYRLAEKTIKLDKNVIGEVSIIIPTRTMQELNRILTEVENKVEISVTENQILFKINDTDLISRLIEGSFPDYRRIIPDSFQTKVLVNTTAFNNMVKTASIFSSPSANNIKLQLKSKGELIIQSSAAQIGENVSCLDADISGGDGEITFNAKYLLDVLNNIESEETLLQIRGKLDPGVIKPAGQEDYIYVIMPLRA
jgi:DNA polymerase-3 subunit beta